MSQAHNDRRIDYIEFPAVDVAQTRAFYERVFGWTFTDYGPDYTSFEDGRITGGFRGADADEPGAHVPKPTRDGVLVVIYAADLEAVQKKIIDAGGGIVRDTFSFPGGRRFHFADPSGNHLAVWSQKLP